MIKIAIPTNNNVGLDDEVAEHFGRCNTYTLLNKEGEVIDIAQNTSEHMGGCGLPPNVIKKLGATILLCNGLGPKALDLCKELDISVYVVKAKTVKEAFDIWKKCPPEIASDNDVCEEHKT